ncbi:hypothetical protein JHK87_000031 [Glycine soja]|nr:hypothetical protein JHK87_000031 [Glycine soja]
MAKQRQEDGKNDVVDHMPLSPRNYLPAALPRSSSLLSNMSRFSFRAEFQSTGLIGSTVRIAKTEGLLGFYRRIIQTFTHVWKGPTLDLVAGSLSGGTAVLFTYPLDLT